LVVANATAAKRRAGNEIEFSRIGAFSDGVFAIAITLLVLNLNVPQHLHGESLGSALWAQRDDLFAYAISFAVIGRFWLIHHGFFGQVTGFDGRLIGLNLFYLAWIVLLPFSSRVLGDHGGAEAAVVLYAVNLTAVILAGRLMFDHARRAGLSTISAEEARDARLGALLVAGVFLVSIPVAFLNAQIAPYCWLALFLAPLAGRAVGVRRS